MLHNGSFANSYTGEGFGGGEMGVGVGVVWCGLLHYLIKGIIIPPHSLSMSSGESDFLQGRGHGGEAGLLAR